MRPALVHSPIMLLPLAVSADLLACIVGGKSPHSLGQKAIALAGEEVNVKQTICATS